MALALALCFFVIHALHALCTADMPITVHGQESSLVEVRPYAEEEDEEGTEESIQKAISVGLQRCSR